MIGRQSNIWDGQLLSVVPIIANLYESHKKKVLTWSTDSLLDLQIVECGRVKGELVEGYSAEMRKGGNTICWISMWLYELLLNRRLAIW